jgi:hypothetical protein
MDDDIERTHTSEADRGNSAQTERFVEDTLAMAGPDSIHTVRSLAKAIYGNDSALEERHLQATRRLVRRLQKRGVPIVPCDEKGKLLSDAEADSHAKQGRTRMWRCYADGRVIRELLEECDSRNSLADGLVALEASPAPRVFCEARERMLKGIRSLLTKAEYDQSRRRYAAALESARQRREAHVGQAWRSTMHEKPAPRRAKGYSYFVCLRSGRPLTFTSGRHANTTAWGEGFWTRDGRYDGTGMPLGRSDDRQCDQHNQN